jgi:hypothetical protein
LDISAVLKPRPPRSNTPSPSPRAPGGERSPADSAREQPRRPEREPTRPPIPGLEAHSTGRTPIIPGLKHPYDETEPEPAYGGTPRSGAPQRSHAERVRDEIAASLVERPRQLLQARLKGETPEQIAARFGVTPERAKIASDRVALHVANRMRERGISAKDARDAVTADNSRPSTEIQAHPNPQQSAPKQSAEPPSLAGPTSPERNPAFPILEGGRSDQTRIKGRYAPESHLYAKRFGHSEKSFVTAERQRRIGNFVDATWKASGLTNAQKHAQLKAALAVRNPRQISSLINSDFGFPSPAALSSAKQAMQEMLNMLPRKIADGIPAFHLRFDPLDTGHYDEERNVLCLNGTHWGAPTWLPHVWHELAHAIYVRAPDSYKATLARHFRVRTQGERVVRVGPDVLGKEDQWLPNLENPAYRYAGRIYEEEVIGAGLELPSEYMSYMQNPEWADFALTNDRETTVKVLSIFFWERTLK